MPTALVPSNWGPLGTPPKATRLNLGRRKKDHGKYLSGLSVALRLAKITGRCVSVAIHGIPKDHYFYSVWHYFSYLILRTRGPNMAFPIFRVCTSLLNTTNIQ